MTNQQREIARILNEEIRFDPTEGPTVGNAIERLTARERQVENDKERYMAKWAVCGFILATVIVLYLKHAKPTPANIEQQLTDTIRPLGEKTLGTSYAVIFRSGTQKHQYVVVMDTAAPQGKTPYYFNDSALLTHPGPQIVLSQKQYLDTIAAGTTLYVDSAKSNDSAWVYVFGKNDTLIWVDKNVNVNKL